MNGPESRREEGTRDAGLAMHEVGPSPGEVLDLLPDAVVLVDEAGGIAFANAAVTRVLGHEPTELVGQPLTVLIPRRYHERHEQHVNRYRSSGEPTIMGSRPVLTALHGSGEEIPVSISIANLEFSGARFSVALIRDASPMRDELGQAIAEAEADGLTGLGNRRCLTRRMRGIREAGRPFGLLFLDLDGFKPFNDRFGHKTGDEVLRLVGKRLKALVRPNDVAARVGGDEFVLLLDGLSDDHDLRVRGEGVVRNIEQPFHLRGAENASVGVSVGGALYPRDGDSEDDVMSVADRNMYRAKKAGRAYCADLAAVGTDTPEPA